MLRSGCKKCECRGKRNEPTVADIVYEGTSRRVYYLKYARPVYAMITQFHKHRKDL